jgi:hypothetical protein
MNDAPTNLLSEHQASLDDFFKSAIGNWQSEMT